MARPMGVMAPVTASNAERTRRQRSAATREWCIGGDGKGKFTTCGEGTMGVCRE